MRSLKLSGIIALLISFTLSSGCGYTQQTALPANIKTIYVETVINTIDVEQIKAYVPGLEMMITNAVIRRLHRDGNLRVVKKEDADAILETNLTAFEQEGTRFNNLERVSEFRLFVVVDTRLRETRTGQVLWEEPNLSGDAEYFVSDVRSIAREEAAQRAVERLAVNIVDRIVEDW